MRRKRRDQEFAWGLAGVVETPEDPHDRVARQRKPGEISGVFALLIFLGILAGAGVIVWQLVEALR
jgi:hypothetical protein